MQTIVINNQKGGVGKTLIAVHLAWFLAEEGGRVLLIDLDGQGNATSVLEEERLGGYAADLFEAGKLDPFAPEPGITVLACDARLHGVELQSVATFIQQFPAIAEPFDYVVIDTPPTWGARNFAAMAVGDHLLAPVEMKDFAIKGVAQLLQSIKAVREKGRGGRPINFLGLLASRFNSHSPRERGNLQTLLDEFGTKLMFPGVVTNRDGYEQAMSDAVPVWKIKSSAASVAGAEIRKILTTVRDRVALEATEAE